MHNALGVVAQLVRASACHAEGRGFEPRQSRQYLHHRQMVFFIKKNGAKNPQGILCVFSCLLLINMFYNELINITQRRKHELEICCNWSLCIGIGGMW